MPSLADEARQSALAIEDSHNNIELKVQDIQSIIIDDVVPEAIIDSGDITFVNGLEEQEVGFEKQFLPVSVLDKREHDNAPSSSVAVVSRAVILVDFATDLSLDFNTPEPLITDVKVMADESAVTESEDKHKSDDTKAPVQPAMKELRADI